MSKRTALLALVVTLASGAAFASPGARYEARMVYDTKTQRILMFGGITGFDAGTKLQHDLGDTWEWNGAKWVQRFTPNAPSARSSYMMVYDTNRQHTLLFGGKHETGYVNDTWKFENGAWSQINTPNSPGARVLAGAAGLLRGDDRVGQSLGHCEEVAPPRAVLEPRQRRLRAERRPGERIAVEQQLVDRIVDQSGGVVAVGVAQRQPEHPLAEQLQDRMLDLPRRPPLRYARGQALGQSQPAVDCLEQDRPTVRTGVGHVEGRHHRLGIPLEPEGQLRYTVCSHRVSSHLCVEATRHRFYSTLARLDGSLVSSFVNNPG